MQAVTGPGRVVAARYELLDRLGQGAMGTVWRARDLVLTREVAIKEVRLPGLMPDEDRKILRERTMREARVSAKLNHPGVVTVYDVIEAGGTPWIVMELVSARSLEQVLAADGPLPPRQVASIGVMLLGALAAAHAAGIVHRDVKPGNVLITGDSRAVLTDFGIATLDGDPGLTQAGMVMGTPGFCAPERVRGAPASPASDLWSLGATLYAAVTGRGPYEGHGSPMAVLASIVHSDPPQLPATGQLGTVIHSLMSKDPAHRPDASCAIGLLADVAAGNSETVLAIGPFPGGSRPATVASAQDRTDPTGFPARAPGIGPPASPGREAPAGPPAPGPAGTAQFPAGTGPEFGPPAGAGVPAAAASVGELTTQTAPSRAGAPAMTLPPAVTVPPAAAQPGQGAAAGAGRAAGPFPVGMPEVPFPDGVGDVKFPVSAGAAVPPWAVSGWPGAPAAGGAPGAPGGPRQPGAPGQHRTQGPQAAPGRPGPSAAGGGPPGAAGGSGRPAALAMASPAVASPAMASPAVASPAMASPAMASPAVASPAMASPAAPGTRQERPPGQQGAWGQQGARPQQEGTRPQPPPRTTGGRVLRLSLAGAAIVLVGLVAGVLFVRAAGNGQPASGGSGRPAPAAGALPAGYQWYTQSSAPGTAAGFALAVPQGWQASRQGAATAVRDPVTGGTITASFTPFTTVGPVREVQALELAAISRGAYPGYRRIAITPWLLRGRLAGAWRFAYRQPGTGLTQGLEVVSALPAAGGSQPYELLVTAPAASWPASRAAFAEALRTLRAGR